MVEPLPKGGVLKIGQRLGRFGDHFRYTAPARLPGNVVAGRPPAVFGPALLSNQRHEHDTAEILFLETRLAATSDLQQKLLSFLLAHRNDQPATNSELLLQ